MLDLGAQNFSVPETLPGDKPVCTFALRGQAFRKRILRRSLLMAVADELFARVGSPYTSIDIKPYPFGIVMDLNPTSCRPSIMRAINW